MIRTSTKTKDRARAEQVTEALGSETRRWSSATTASSRRAYERRIRRRQKMSEDRLIKPGRKVSATAFNRAPFVAALIVLLGLGVSAVLWLNTLTGEAGMRTSAAKSRTTDLRLTIEQLRRDVAMLDATPRIADQAKALGMVQAGDAAMLIVDGSGAGTVVGAPSAVVAPAPSSPAPAPSSAAPGPSPDPAAQQAAAPTTPAPGPSPDPAARQAAAPTTPAPAGEPRGGGQ